MTGLVAAMLVVSPCAAQQNPQQNPQQIPQQIPSAESAALNIAANPKPITVYDFAAALNDAKNNDPRIAAAEQNIVAQNAASNIKKMSAWPQISATAYIGYYDQRKFQQVPGYAIFNGQRTPFGTRAGVVTSFGLIRYANLAANQEIINFGRRQADEAISDSQARMAQWQKKQVMYQIISDVADNYIGCATANEVKKTKEYYLASLRGIYDEVKKKYDLNTETITNLNLVAVNYRDASNELLLQKQQVAVTCRKLLRLIADPSQDNTYYQKLMDNLSLASIDNYQKLIPDNFEDFKNTVWNKNPDVAIAQENLNISQKTKELSAANLLPTVSWNAKVDQLSTPNVQTPDSLVTGGLIRNDVVNLTVNYQQNIPQNIFQLAASGHNLAQQQYLTDYQLQTITNQLLGLWQNYQAKKQSLPLVAQSLRDQMTMLTGAEKQYRLGVIPLSAYLQQRQEFLSTMIQYHQLHQAQLATSLSLLTYLEDWS